MSVFVVVWTACTVAAALIGKAFGYPLLGWVLGFLIGVFGIAVILCRPGREFYPADRKVSCQHDVEIHELRRQVEAAELRNKLASLDRQFYQGDSQGR